MASAVARKGKRLAGFDSVPGGHSISMKLTLFDTPNGQVFINREHVVAVDVSGGVAVIFLVGGEIFKIGGNPDKVIEALESGKVSYED